MIYIGIDPDVDKSGYAKWDSVAKKFIAIADYKFFDLIRQIGFDAKRHDAVFLVESGWLNKKANFHSKKGQSKSVGETIARSVGANHQVGKLIVEYCRDNAIEVHEVKPLLKKWGKNGNSKINAIEFMKLSGWNGLTNPEKRDAAMLVMGK